jgi:NitT/TauT family transport system permease protein
LATNVLEQTVVPQREGRLQVTGDAARPGALTVAVRVLTPPLTALAALAVHWGLRDKQLLPMSWMDGLTAWQHPYPLLLAGLLVLSLAAAVAQAVWEPVRPWIRLKAPLWAGAILVLCAWEFITLKRAWLPQPYFPGPDQVLGAILEDYLLLLQSTQQSLLLLFCGYLTGVAAGLLSGVLIGWFFFVRYWGTPVLKLIGPLPATALVPLAMMLTPKSQAFLTGVLLIAFAVWFPVTMLTASGLANVRLSYLDVARTLGAGRLYLIFRVAIPAAMPQIFIGLFMGLGASFLTLLVAETVGVEGGLGWYVGWKRGYAEYDKVYASLLIMMILFSAIMTLLFKVRDRVLKWQQGVIRW